jgi:hypothetical protein
MALRSSHPIADDNYHKFRPRLRGEASGCCAAERHVWHASELARARTLHGKTAISRSFTVRRRKRFSLCTSRRRICMEHGGLSGRRLARAFPSRPRTLARVRSPLLRSRPHVPEALSGAPDRRGGAIARGVLDRGEGEQGERRIHARTSRALTRSRMVR